MRKVIFNLFVVIAASAAWPEPSIEQHKEHLHQRHNDEVYEEHQPGVSPTNRFEPLRADIESLNDRLRPTGNPFRPRYEQSLELPQYPVVTPVNRQRESTLFGKIDDVIALLKTLLVREMRFNRNPRLPNNWRYKDDLDVADDIGSGAKHEVNPSGIRQNVPSSSPSSAAVSSVLAEIAANDHVSPEADFADGDSVPDVPQSVVDDPTFGVVASDSYSDVPEAGRIGDRAAGTVADGSPERNAHEEQNRSPVRYVINGRNVSFAETLEDVTDRAATSGFRAIEKNYSNRNIEGATPDEPVVNHEANEATVAEVDSKTNSETEEQSDNIVSDDIVSDTNEQQRLPVTLGKYDQFELAQPIVTFLNETNGRDSAVNSMANEPIPPVNQIPEQFAATVVEPAGPEETQ